MAYLTQKSSKKSLFGAKAAILISTVLTGAFLIAPAAAIAGSAINIMADRAKIIKVAGKVASVIVGNPAFADVSVQKSYIIVYGRNFGQTNILVLDKNGNQLANLDVSIIRGPDRNIAVYRAGDKASYACSPKCESTLQVGDSANYFKAVNEAISTKMGLATVAGKLTAK